MKICLSKEFQFSNFVPDFDESGDSSDALKLSERLKDPPDNMETPEMEVENSSEVPDFSTDAEPVDTGDIVGVGGGHEDPAEASHGYPEEPCDVGEGNGVEDEDVGPVKEHFEAEAAAEGADSLS